MEWGDSGQAGVMMGGGDDGYTPMFHASVSVREIDNGFLVEINKPEGRSETFFFPPRKADKIPLFICERMGEVMQKKLGISA